MGRLSRLTGELETRDPRRAKEARELALLLDAVEGKLTRALRDLADGARAGTGIVSRGVQGGTGERGLLEAVDFVVDARAALAGLAARELR